jgi:hypothetical protein
MLHSLKTAVRELPKYKLHLVGVEVRWDKGGTELADDYTFFMEMSMLITIYR